MNSFDAYCDQRPFVLLIDEEAQVRQELAASLEAHGYRVRGCSNAAEAYAAAADDCPQFVISDVLVHELSGMEICEKIKRDAVNSDDLHVMFLSANQIPDIIRRRSPFGGSYYLRKPVDCGVLLDLLEKTLAATRQLALVGK
jgi:DNA-binding response OmpR family regulator